MMGVEDRLPGGLATAEDALLDPRMLDAALEAIGVPPLTSLLGLASSRAELGRVVELGVADWILLDVGGVSGSFLGE